MLKLIQISDWLVQTEPVVLLDIRSEGEYLQGHIPGAISFPILNNEERKLVGTCYKQKGHEEAVVLGYKLVGPKFYGFIELAYKEFKGKEIFIHCWRGGLRSQIMGNVLSTAGFKVNLIKGGYKLYRTQVLEYLSQEFTFEVLGGFTGCRKTEILEEIHLKGAQVLNLEYLASHKGSAFGYLGMPNQPSQEHFENLIFEKLRRFNSNLPIWIEDESRLIGRVQVPDAIYGGIRSSFVHFLDIPFEKRLNQIINSYGRFPADVLVEITSKLKKRMGDQANRNAIDFLNQGDIKGWAEIVLKHYDKQYLFGFSKRESTLSMNINLEEVDIINYLTGINNNKNGQLV
ncbi:MAG: tRNA 2-selenouridine(34) synthase MnmH [Bacteroidia bacterium]|nr:tRNA 2-selenouridine(34) synthase MnmH [Bacteroidia bacterium]MCF8425611.1 tRNA 2-selenouridine(34) synthase MnmH [Bacteroidia bacterium]MCF8445686.1 tRNA 2-selenouridine(34) synthase MnmH [Bacteroidia bacterium]